MAAKKPTTKALDTKRLSALAEMANEQASTENVGAETTYLQTRGGVLALGSTKLQDNKVLAVIVSNVWKKKYSDVDFDPDNYIPPCCYAIGKDLAALTPHAESEKPQNDDCNSCDWNKFGSAKTGKGKACSDSRTLALIPLGVWNKKSRDWDLTDSIDDISDGTLGLLNVPATSLRNFATYVKETAAEYKLPLCAIGTEIRLVPDENSNFKVEFEMVSRLDGEQIDAVLDRVDSATEALSQPFPKAKAEDKPKGKPKRGSKKL